MNPSFWNGKKVFLTGHTGFKGSWLSLWLNSLGSKVWGYASKLPTATSLFNLCDLKEVISTFLGNMNDLTCLRKSLQESEPEIVIHLAAQPLVSEALRDPVGTYETNIMGTVNLFEAIRNTPSVKAVINVSTEKCYENKGCVWGYRENDPVGGVDPYSSSKTCSEIITATYRSSYFPPGDYLKHGLAIACVRPGNVIGGGDWTKGRLIPDACEALLQQKPILIKNPHCMRPWQHVLEPLSGYTLLAEKLYQEGPAYGDSWNFGPEDRDIKEVEWIVKYLCSLWGNDACYQVIGDNKQYTKPDYLKLECSKAKVLLGWQSRWNIETALAKTVAWVKEFQAKSNIRQVCLDQIAEYMSTI